MKRYKSLIRLCFFLVLSLSQLWLKSQGLGINSSGTAANQSSMLDVDVSGLAAKKGLLIPRMTQAQRIAMNPLPAIAKGLMVYQTDGSEGIYYNTSTTLVPSWQYLASGANTNWGFSGNALTGASSSTANEWIGTSNNYDWVIKTNNTEKLRITSAGRVGIGISNPTSAVSIIGDIDISGSRLHVDPISMMVGINNSTPNSTLDIIGGSGTPFSSSLNVRNWLGQPILIGRDDQRVGIGTSNPTSQLSVVGEIDISGSRLHIDPISMMVGINNVSPSSTLDIFGTGGSQLTSSLNIRNMFGQTIIFGRDDQRVGIGTSNPTSQLSVVGEIDISGSRLHIDPISMKVGINNNSPNSTLDILGTGSSNSTSSLNIRNLGGQTILFGRDDLFVGIGNSNPNSNLSVFGSVSYTVITKSASYTLTASDHCIIYIGAAGSTITIPAASGVTGRVYIITNHGTAALATSLAYTTANATTSSTVATGTSVQIISDGTIWRKIN